LELDSFERQAIQDLARKLAIPDEVKFAQLFQRHLRRELLLGRIERLRSEAVALEGRHLSEQEVLAMVDAAKNSMGSL
jgi:hypothetical protein